MIGHHVGVTDVVPAPLSGPDASGQHRVRLLGEPLDLYLSAQEHHQELMREFALMAVLPPVSRPGHDVPQRLLDLVDSLGRRFSGIAVQAETVREEALARRQATVDLEFDVPSAVAAACLELGALLAEADDYCRQGDLLTLATPAPIVAYRQWYLGEFVRQVAGEPPRSWADQQAGATGDDPVRGNAG